MIEQNVFNEVPVTLSKLGDTIESVTTEVPEPKGDWQMTVEEFSFAGCHYNSSCD